MRRSEFELSLERARSDLAQGVARLEVRPAVMRWKSENDRRAVSAAASTSAADPYTSTGRS